VAVAAAAALAKCGYLLGLVLGAGGFMTWAERKHSAMIQDRIGANRASCFGIRAMGLFHIVTDALKMLTKEDYIPPFADRLLFWLAPLAAGIAATIGFVVIPFGPVLHAFGTEIPLVIVRSEVGMLILLGALGLTVYGAFLAGMATPNKWALLGALRAAAQMAAYEIVIGLSLVGVFMVHETLDLYRIAEAQAGWCAWASFLPNWGLLTQPLAFLLFYTAAIAETKRAPFDLPEGESEIIGYFVEFSGMRFGLFFMSELIETVLFGAVLTVLFLGAWHWPGVDYAAMPWWAALGVSQVVFWGKVAACCWLSLLIRWTLPRFRYDQLLDLGWKYLLPAAIANVLLTGAVLMGIGRGT
jgi:NADH-quinone oxidoreductase subunit H